MGAVLGAGVLFVSELQAIVANRGWVVAALASDLNAGGFTAVRAKLVGF